jgi:hypothetical protein
MAMNDVVGQFVLNDIKSSMSAQTRVQYNDALSPNWATKTGLHLNATFPNIDRYLNAAPFIEFSYSYDYSTRQTRNRLNQYYVDVRWLGGELSFGQKKISYEDGRFVSYAPSSIFPRVFNLVGYSSKKIELIWLHYVVNPDSDNIQYYPQGSYILAFKDMAIRSPFSHNLHFYLIENVGDTVSFNTAAVFAKKHRLSSTAALQFKPYRLLEAGQKKSVVFYDAIYTYTHQNSSLKLGTRFFESNKWGGFAAPFSRRWNGFLNAYRYQESHGYDTDFRSVFAQLTLPIWPQKTVLLAGYLFRDAHFDSNLGAEIDISIKNVLIHNTFEWHYQLGQFFSGSDSKIPSFLQMRLDFSLYLNPNNEQ